MNIIDGILIGGTGGAVAGITVWVVQLLHSKYLDYCDKNRIYDWLSDPSKRQEDRSFRTTRAIASWTNLPEDRVRYICSIDERITLSTGTNEDLWKLRDRDKK
jgi:hypothetical protein